MATVVGKTSVKIDQLLSDLVNDQVVRGEVTPQGDLLLFTRGGSSVMAGPVVGPRGDTGVVTVKHHDNTSTPRPTGVTVVHWIGEATPTNAIPTDWWTKANIP